MNWNLKILMNIILWVCKAFSSFFVGFTIAIIIQTLLNSGTFSVVFITLSMALAFLKLVWNYKFIGLIVCNLFFTSLFLLFKLYVNLSAS